jgi:hypothetical protein
VCLFHLKKSSMYGPIRALSTAGVEVGESGSGGDKPSVLRTSSAGMEMSSHEQCPKEMSRAISH